MKTDVLARPQSFAACGAPKTGRVADARRNALSCAGENSARFVIDRAAAAKAHCACRVRKIIRGSVRVAMEKVRLVTNERGVHLEKVRDEPAAVAQDDEARADSQRPRARSDAFRSFSVQRENPDHHALAASFVRAWNGHDAAALSQCWVEDGDILSAGGEKAEGRADIEAMFGADFGDGGTLSNSVYRAKVTHVRELGPGLALVDWSTVVEGVVNKDGPVPPSSCSVACLCRQARGGEWALLSVRPQG